MCNFTIVWFSILLSKFLNFAKISFVENFQVFDLFLPDGSLTVQIGSKQLFCFTSIPSFGRLSMPRMFL